MGINVATNTSGSWAVAPLSVNLGTGNADPVSMSCGASEACVITGTFGTDSGQEEKVY
jgi:hypothetical protein